MFVSPSEADEAIASLAAGACEVLVVSDTLPGRAAQAAIDAGGHVAFHHIDVDTSGTLAPQLAETLRMSRPFSALGVSVRSETGGPCPPPGMQRLFQNLVHHLAAGAAVVIVHVPGAEQQLWVSRALLDAKCDILLTHDVLQPPILSDAAHDEDCCRTCASRSCDREAPRNGASEAFETKP